MMPIHVVEFNDCVRLVIDSRLFRRSHLQEKPTNQAVSKLKPFLQLDNDQRLL